MSEGLTSTKTSSIKLGTLAEITMGQSPDSTSVNSQEQGLPFLQGCAEFGNQTPTPLFHCQPPLRIAKEGSVLISVRAPVGTLNWADQRYCIGRGLGAIKGNGSESDTRFLYYALDHGQHFLHKRSQGSTFLAISANDLRIFPVPNYSPATQQKIARILQTVDRAIEKTEALIEKYQQIKAGLMHDLFTRGLWTQEELDRGDHKGTPAEATAKVGQLRPKREEAPELYHETEIGWIPKVWKAVSLVEIVHFQRGHDIVGSQFVKGEYPVVSSGGVIGFHNEFTTKSPGVVVGRKGTVGKVHYMDTDFWAHDTSLYSTSLFGNDAWFVFYLCVWLDLSRFSTKSGSPSLNRNDIHPLPTIHPTTEEQGAISDRLRSCDSHIAAFDTELLKLQKQKSGLMHDLLTGTVSVTPDAQP